MARSILLLSGLMALAGSLLVVGCQSSGVAEMPVVGLGEACGAAVETQCSLELSCLNRRCYKLCSSDLDCTAYPQASACIVVPALVGVGNVCGEPGAAGGAGGVGGAGGAR